MAAGAVMLLMSIGTMFAYIIRRRLWRWWIFLYFLVAGAAGCIVTFLVFCSEHEATSPNILIWWLNPLQLLIAAGIWWKSWRKPVAVTAAYDLLMGVALTILIATHMTPQRINPATWPMLLSILPLAATILLSYKRTTHNAQTHNAKK